MPPAFTVVLLAALAIASCHPAELEAHLAALRACGFPANIHSAISGRILKSPARFLELARTVIGLRKGDPWLLIRVDKRTALPADFVPPDLLGLDGGTMHVSRPGHRLRKPALSALETMHAAAHAAGIRLVVSSAYRSYDYQRGVYERNAAREGIERTDLVIARPGHSQHQLGTAVDFGSIDNGFANTAAGRWVAANAGRFGFSLSYPAYMTAITGYEWESWHYRYIGLDAVALQDEYFLGVQTYLIEYLDALPR